MLFINDSDDNKPLIINSKLCIYSSNVFIELINNLGFQMDDEELCNSIELCYDPQRVISLIKMFNLDRYAVLINSINIVLDVIKALNIKIPDLYKKQLYEFADHLTFNKRYGAFFRNSTFSKEDIIDVFYWINGAVLTNSAFDVIPLKKELDVNLRCP